MTVPRWPGHPRRGSPMSAPGPDPSQPSAVSGRQLALIVYILYPASYFTGITALIGVIHCACPACVGGCAVELALSVSNSHVLDWAPVSCDRNRPGQRGRRDRCVVLVVRLVARTQRQRRAGAQ